ncbi:glycosyltransferase family protein [Thermococcus eurythermalis]|uniref:hypothetical protein n=1 Tax=Thermococcus eurythermalis TaxID=1505907 RepID=UPI0006784768|nr:hypothetical protein [Thermococcus eurythermalis]
MLKKHQRYIILFIVAISLFLVSVRALLLYQGYVILSEQLEAISYEKFWPMYKFAWDCQVGLFPLEEFPKVYLYNFLILVSKNIFHLSFRSFEILLLGLQFPLGFIFAYCLLKYFIKNTFLISQEDFKVEIASIVGAIIYVINPWVAVYQHNISLKFQHALLPLTYLYFLKTLLEHKKLRYAIIGATLLALVASYRYIAVIIPIYLVTIMWYLVSNKNGTSLMSLFKSIIYYGGFFILFSLGKFIAPILYSVSMPAQVAPAKNFDYSYMLLEKTVNVFASRFSVYSWSLIYWDSLMYLFLVIMLLTLLSYILPKKQVVANNSMLLLPITIYLVYLPFTSEDLNIFRVEVLWRSSIMMYFLRLLRQGRINYMPALLALSMMTSIFLYKIMLRLDKKIFSSVLVAIVVISSISAWPIFTGDMNGYWTPAKIPTDYTIANSLMENNINYHALWVPPFSTARPVWLNTTRLEGPPAGIFAMRNSNLPVYYHRNIYFFDYYGPLTPFPFVYPLSGYKGTDLPKLYYSINIKYLILHYDLNSSAINPEDIKSKIGQLRQLGFREVYTGNYLTMFQIFNNTSSRIRIGSIIVITNKGLPVYESIVHPANFRDLQELGLVFYSETNRNSKILKISSSVVLDSPEDFSIFATPSTRIYPPAIYADRMVTTYNKGWRYVPEISSPTFQRAVSKEKTLPWSWDFDYSKGLVMTNAEFQKSSNTISNKTLVAIWTFQDKRELSAWANYTDQIQWNSIQTLSLQNGTLVTTLYNSTWGWKTVKSPLIHISSSHVYHFELRIKGYNAHGVHIKVLELDKDSTPILTRYVKTVGSGTFDWKTVTFDYQPENENTKYLQLQIWHGHETDKPLPNVIWVDDVKVYDITNYTKPVTLEIPFKVDKTDNYKIFIRYFKNQKGGAIRVYLDGTPIYIKTKDQLNKFVWKDLGTFKLEKGEHKIVLENVRGFNAVNLFALVPENEYYKAKEEVKRLLQNKTVIYIFEAESDLYNSNADTIKNLNASNGELIKFKDDGEAWQDMEIVKNSTYKIALKGIGTFNVSIGNYSYILSSENLTFRYTPTFYLREGKYKLKITPVSKDAILDVVWLYSTDNNETLEDIFNVNETPATVQNYTKINPTLWKVKVNATKPFFLTFAESYDPLWEARVYKDGKLVEKVKPVPVYGVINGFWINQTGDLEIVLRYTPQDWFERGLIISLTTFVLSIFYIFYDWRREKGDRWAGRLEEKFKRLAENVKSRIFRR